MRTRASRVLRNLSIPVGPFTSDTPSHPHCSCRKPDTSARPATDLRRSTPRGLVESARVQNPRWHRSAESRSCTSQPAHARVQVQSPPLGLCRKALVSILLDILRHSARLPTTKSSAKNGDRPGHPSCEAVPGTACYQTSNETDPVTESETAPLATQTSKRSGTPTSHRQRGQTQSGTERRFTAPASARYTPLRRSTTGGTATIPNGESLWHRYPGGAYPQQQAPLVRGYEAGPTVSIQHLGSAGPQKGHILNSLIRRSHAKATSTTTPLKWCQVLHLAQGSQRYGTYRDIPTERLGPAG